MPRDLDELLRIYQSTIRKALRCDVRHVWLVAHHLWYRSVLERFKVPAIVTYQQAILYLGIESPAWLASARKRPEVLPAPAEGKITSTKSKYRLSDLQQAFDNRDALFSRASKGVPYEPLVPGLAEFIVAESLKIEEELKSTGYIFDIPPHIPHSFDRLTEMYLAEVVKTVRFKLRYGMEPADAVNEVLATLYKSDPAVKFVRGAENRLPAQMSVEDVLDYLGIEWPAWQRMMRTNPRAPNPVKGEASSPYALYAGEDIRALAGTGYFKRQGLRFLPVSSMTKAHFDSYMKRSIDNALQNVFRNNDRHFNKEDTLSDGACIHDNRRVRTLRREEADIPPWEDSLTSMAIPADTLVDIKRRVEVRQAEEQA